MPDRCVLSQTIPQLFYRISLFTLPYPTRVEQHSFLRSKQAQQERTIDPIPNKTSPPKTPAAATISPEHESPATLPKFQIADLRQANQQLQLIPHRSTHLLVRSKPCQPSQFHEHESWEHIATSSISTRILPFPCPGLAHQIESNRSHDPNTRVLYIQKDYMHIYTDT
jgi:hypothetical protein